MGEPMTNLAIEAIRGFQDELNAIRRDLHANPELGLEEHRTAEIVAAKLAEWGIEAPEAIKGHVQSRFDGVSMRSSFSTEASLNSPRSSFDRSGCFISTSLAAAVCVIFRLAISLFSSRMSAALS
jgi:metal-dependent amidase/aminoacylase/carboxypeptidase family protein